MTNRTNVQRLARERQRATGEKYTKCLAYVRAHQDELIPEYLARRRRARVDSQGTTLPPAPQHAEQAPPRPTDQSGLAIRFRPPSRSDAD